MSYASKKIVKIGEYVHGDTKYEIFKAEDECIPEEKKTIFNDHPSYKCYGLNEVQFMSDENCGGLINSLIGGGFKQITTSSPV